MAKGDAVIGVVNVAGSSRTSVQPGSGVRWAIRDWGSAQETAGGAGAQDGYLRLSVELYNGSIYTVMYDVDAVDWGNERTSILCTNTIYIRLWNDSGSSGDMHYSGVEV